MLDSSIYFCRSLAFDNLIEDFTHSLSEFPTRRLLHLIITWEMDLE
jgi:hypothetical protein